MKNTTAKYGFHDFSENSRKPRQGSPVIVETENGLLIPCIFHDGEFVKVAHEGEKLIFQCEVHSIKSWIYEIDLGSEQPDDHIKFTERVASIVGIDPALLLLESPKDKFINLKKPICAKCKKPVDEFGEYFNPDDACAKSFYAKCHGETEIGKLTFHQLQEFGKGNSDLSLGEAFTGNDSAQIEQKPKEIEVAKCFGEDRTKNCPFLDDGCGGDYPEYCNIKDETGYRRRMEGVQSRPDWCPLKSGPIIVRLKENHG